MASTITAESQGVNATNSGATNRSILNSIFASLAATGSNGGTVTLLTAGTYDIDTALKMENISTLTLGASTTIRFPVGNTASNMILDALFDRDSTQISTGITIIGGTLDKGYSRSPVYNGEVFNPGRSNIEFRACDNFTVASNLTNSDIHNIMPSKCSGGTITGAAFSCVGDGIHINGPVNGMTISNCTGSVADVIVGTTAGGDYPSVVVAPFYGDIKNVNVDTIRSNHSAGVVSLTGRSGYTISGWKIKNLVGSVGGNSIIHNVAVALFDDSGGGGVPLVGCTMTDIMVDGVNVISDRASASSAYGAVWINATNAKSVVVRNITRPPVGLQGELEYPSSPTVSVASAGTSLELGTRFIVSYPSRTSQVRFWHAGAMAAGRAFTLWNFNTQTILATGVSSEVAGWNTINLTSSVDLWPSTQYMLSYGITAAEQHPFITNELNPQVASGTVLFTFGGYAVPAGSIPDNANSDWYGATPIVLEGSSYATEQASVFIDDLNGVHLDSLILDKTASAHRIVTSSGNPPSVTNGVQYMDTVFYNASPSPLTVNASGTAFELGTRFHVTGDCHISQAAVWHAGTMSASRAVHLWNWDTGTLLATGSTSGEAAGWNLATFSTVNLVAGVNYMVSYAITAADNFSSVVGEFTSPVTVGLVVFDKGGYTTSVNTNPNNVTSDWYGIDALIVEGAYSAASGSGPSVLARKRMKRRFAEEMQRRING